MSAIFQSKIEQVLQGIPMVVCRVDDILVSGKNDHEHLNNLSEVLTRLESAGLTLKLSKCKFMQPTVEDMGYQVDVQGLHAVKKKRSHSKCARKSKPIEVIPGHDKLVCQVNQ